MIGCDKPDHAEEGIDEGIEIGEDIDLGGLSTEKSIDNGSKRTIEISNGAGSVEIRFH